MARTAAATSGGWRRRRHLGADVEADDGSLVRLRASTENGTIVSSGAWRWPDAEHVPPLDAVFDARFLNVRHRGGIVEATVLANAPLDSVEARVGKTRWTPLELGDDGDWRGQVRGQGELQLRARSLHGDVVERSPR